MKGSTDTIGMGIKKLEMTNMMDVTKLLSTLLAIPLSSSSPLPRRHGLADSFRHFGSRESRFPLQRTNILISHRLMRKKRATTDRK